MTHAISGHFDKAVKMALQENLPELAQRYIRKATVLVTGEERKSLWM